MGRNMNLILPWKFEAPEYLKGCKFFEVLGFPISQPSQNGAHTSFIGPPVDPVETHFCASFNPIFLSTPHIPITYACITLCHNWYKSISLLTHRHLPKHNFILIHPCSKWMHGWALFAGSRLTLGSQDGMQKGGRKRRRRNS